MAQVVLVGAGHAHTAVLAAGARFVAAGIELTLVDPGNFWFGYARAALLAGHTSRQSLRFSVARLCAARGARYRCARAVGLDTRHRRLWLADGEVLAYDAVSVDAGVRFGRDGFGAATPGARLWDAASVDQLGHLYAALGDDSAAPRKPRVAIAGAGAIAASVVAGLSAAAFASRLALTVYLPGQRLLPDAPAGASRRLARIFAARGVDLVGATPIEGVDGRTLLARGGRRFAADHLILAADARPPSIAYSLGLAADRQGIRVTSRLYAPKTPRVFAAGACAALPNGGPAWRAPLARQAKVLAHNLIAGLTDRPYRGLRVGQSTQTIDLADRSALAWRGRWWWHGRGAARAKQRRDARLRATLGLPG